MRAKQPFAFILVGFALFSMFFGGGNLIFPLFLGQIAMQDWQSAFLGFCITAVLLPLMAVFALVLYQGSSTYFFSHLGKIPALLMPLTLLTVWIPLGSAPRCVALAYASLLPYFNMPVPLAGFALIYCGISFWMVWHKDRMLKLLGYFTPLLLLSLGLIICLGISPSILHTNWQVSASTLVRGLREGYNTMDMIAAFFFSASIIDILRRSSQDTAHSLTTTLKAALVAGLLLVTVYLGMICLAVCQSEALIGIPKEQLFVHTAKVVLGPQLGIIATLAVFSACLTTSIALASVYADFMAERLFKNNNKYRLSLALTQLITFAMAVTGLEGITFVTEPLLQILYPLLLLTIVVNLTRKALVKNNLAPAVEAAD